MPHLGHTSIKHVIAAGAALSVLALALVSGVSLIQASRSGAEAEAEIATAQAALTKHEDALREAMVLATGIDSISVPDAKRAAGIALRRRASDGGRLAIVRLSETNGRVARSAGLTRNVGRTVSRETAAAVLDAATQYIAKAPAYQAQLSKAKTAYALELDSSWNGMWMSLAGYPKMNLSPSKPRKVLPEIEAPAPAPAAVPNAVASDTSVAASASPEAGAPAPVGQQ